MAATTPSPLSAEVEHGLRRLKLASIRQVAPEMLVTAKTQRWAPEELLRALVEVEITAGRQQRSAADQAGELPDPQDRRRVRPVSEQHRAADLGLPHLARVDQSAGERDPDRAAGTGKSHALIALGHAAVETGLRVRYFIAAELVENLYRGLADNSVGRLIETVLRNDLIICDEVGFAPLDSTGSQLLFRFVAAAYERRSLAIASHWAFENWGRFLPEHSTAVSLLDRLLHHNNIVATDGESYRMREARSRSGGRPSKR